MTGIVSWRIDLRSHCKKSTSAQGHKQPLVHINLQILFVDILWLIAELPPPPDPEAA